MPSRGRNRHKKDEAYRALEQALYPDIFIRASEVEEWSNTTHATRIKKVWRILQSDLGVPNVTAEMQKTVRVIAKWFSPIRSAYFLKKFYGLEGEIKGWSDPFAEKHILHAKGTTNGQQQLRALNEINKDRITWLKQHSK